MNNTVSFESNTLRIGLNRTTPQPTAVPVTTVAPPVLVTAAPADSLLGQGRGALMTAAMALGALFAAVLALFIVSTCIRLYKKGKSNAAYDHLELAERRDYTEVPEETEFDEEIEDEPDQADDEFKVPPARVELPHERVLNQAEEEARKAAEELKEIPATDEEGGYRVSRASAQEEQKPAAEEPAKEKPEEPMESAAPVETRRRRRSARREDNE